MAGKSAANVQKKIDELMKTYQTFDEPDFTKTGSVVLDALLGGGIAAGSFIMWSSGSGIGKSTGALFVSRSYCARGKKVCYLDFEGGVNKSQLDGIGLTPYIYDSKTNPNGLFYGFRARTFVDAENIINAMLDEVDLIVIDSVLAMVPQKIQEESVEKILPGLTSRLMANFMLKYKGASIKAGTSWIIINQMRTHIRFIGMTTDEEGGGNALKFYPDIRVLMKKAKKGDLTSKEVTPRGVVDVPYGSINEIWCVKSRYSRPFIPLRLAVIFGKGISNNYAFYDFLDHMGCITAAGAWYTIKVPGAEPAKVNGERKIIEWIQDNRDIVKQFIDENGGFRMIMDKTDAALSDEDMAMSGVQSSEDYDGESIKEGDLGEPGEEVYDE